jgi:uncharacterized membrane protein
MDVPLALAAGIFLIIVVPVLAIAAFVRVRHLEENSGKSPILIQRIYELEQRLGALENRSRAASSSPAETSPTPAPPREAPSVPPQKPADDIARVSPTPQLPKATTLSPAVPAPPASAPRVEVSPTVAEELTGGRLDLETMIAGRWLNRVGLLALLFAVSFFIKYAFENNWVGPRGRIAIGLLAGSALFPWSQALLRKGYLYFSEGIAALGAAVLYLTLWAGWHFYKIFPQDAAFAGMIVVTAAVVAVALGRNSQRVALLGLIGGFLTPELVSTGHDAQVVLFTYVLILGAGLLALAWARGWAVLTPVAYVSTQIYYWGWYERFYGPEKLERTTLFATLFFLVYAALPTIRGRKEGRLADSEIAVLLANVFIYIVALREMLWDEHRWALTLAVLALAAAHLAVARGLPARAGGGVQQARLLFAGLALTLVTAVIPIRLEGKWITMAWAVEGAVLIWSGLRDRILALRAAGLLLYVVVATRLLAFPIPATRFLLNARFAAYLVAVACFGAALVFVRAGAAKLDEGEGKLYAALGIALNVYALIALSLEAWDLFGRMQTLGIDRHLAQQLSLSLVWTLYASALLVLGMRRGVAALRWQALVLLGIVVGKVFLFDLSFLERFYRIMSFFVLGLVLLLVSFFYQRKLAAGATEKQS